MSEPTTSDVTCAGCGYSLRGLSREGRCPECGLPVQAPTDIDDPLTRMPIEVIRRFRAGCWLATFCVAGLLAVAAARRARVYDDEKTLAVILLLLAAGWMASAWILTPIFDLPQAVRYGFCRRGRMRLLARWLPAGWIVVAAAGIADAVVSPAPAAQAGWAQLVRVVELVGGGVGLAGVMALGVLLQRLAVWARDPHAERALELALWGVPMTTVLLMILPTILVVTWLIGILWIVCLCAYPYALLVLSRSMMWSVWHAHEYQNRLRRQRKRRDKYDRETARTIARMDAARTRAEADVRGRSLE